MHEDAVDGIVIRRARTADVAGIRRLVDVYAPARQLLSKATVTLYEDIQEFLVAEAVSEAGAAAGQPGASGAARIVGCGALHVMWEDLAEIRTIAVDPDWHGRRIGHRLATGLLDNARRLGVERVFVLTFETEFFSRHGFVPIDGAPVPHRVYEELLRSYDEGVAEFLDLERVKPNTLGNTRMLLTL
ncbi:MAG: amino-acid N-acetyltransferase [Micromonosporaceae bacterium]